MPGIERIRIISDWDDWRTRMSKSLEPTADFVLRKAFNDIGMKLKSGVDIIECTKEQAVSRYDWKEGIDTLLYFDDGTKATLQEKYLTYHTSTVTFEEKKGDGSMGAWYYCTAQYYFVAYARGYKQGDMSFHDWIILDYPRLQRLDKQEDLKWNYNQNKNDNRKATFKFLYFTDIPDIVVVNRKNSP